MRRQGVLHPCPFCSLMDFVRSHISSNDSVFFVLVFLLFFSSNTKDHEASKLFDMSVTKCNSLSNLHIHFHIGDDVVPYKYGEKSANCLSISGFRHLTFKSFEGYLFNFFYLQEYTHE